MQYTDSQFKFRIDVPAGWVQQPLDSPFAAGGGRVAFAHPNGGSVSFSCGPPNQGTPIDVDARTKMLLELLENVPGRTGRPHRWMQPASPALNIASCRVRVQSSHHAMISIIRNDLEYAIQCRNTDAIALSMSNIVYSFRFTDDVDAPVFKNYSLVGCVLVLLAAAAILALIWFYTARPVPVRESVRFLAVAYISALNAAIGCYLGWFGSDGFARPRPIAYVIMLLGVGAGWFLVYAQNNFGFHAEAKHIIGGAACLALAFIGTKALHARRG